MPVPAPAAAYADLQWTRVQLGLQDGDIKRLTPLLSDIQGLTDPAGGQKVWYARVVVAHGNVAQIQLTVRLALDPATPVAAGKPVTQWGPAEFSKIERQALARGARKSSAIRRSAGLSDPGLDAPEDTVISVGLVNTLDLESSVP